MDVDDVARDAEANGKFGPRGFGKVYERSLSHDRILLSPPSRRERSKAQSSSSAGSRAAAQDELSAHQGICPCRQGESGMPEAIFAVNRRTARGVGRT